MAGEFLSLEVATVERETSFRSCCKCWDLKARKTQMRSFDLAKGRRLLLLLLLCAGCVTQPGKNTVENKKSVDAMHLDLCAQFVIHGEVKDGSDNSVVSGATIVFVDTGLGSLFGVQKVVGVSDNEGGFKHNFEYCWGLDVCLPPEFLLDQNQVEQHAKDGLLSHGQVEDLYTAKRDQFEVWVVADGFHVARKLFFYEDLQQIGYFDSVDCGTMELRRK